MTPTGTWLSALRWSAILAVLMTLVPLFPSGSDALAFTPPNDCLSGTDGEQPPWHPPCGGSTVRLSFHGGSAIPAGAFANSYKAGVNGIVDFTLFFRPDISLMGMVGYNRFSPKLSTFDGTSDINVSVNLRYYYFRPGAIALYVGAGPGLYFPESGPVDPGVNVGFGIDWCMMTGLILEAGVDYHRIFGPDIQFLHAHGGVIIPL